MITKGQKKIRKARKRYAREIVRSYRRQRKEIQIIIKEAQMPSATVLKISKVLESNPESK